MTVSGSLPFATPGGTAQIAMAPARVSRNPIDYGTKTGSLLYDRSTKSLFVDAKDAFDLKSDGLMNFLDAINCRGRECGWQIFTMNNTAGDPKDLLTECGDLTIDDVIAQATAVFTIHPLTRNAQEDGQLFACINNSMTQGAIDVLNLRQDKFLLSAPINEYSGICFLRVIIAEAQVDTCATTNLLLGQLTSGLPDIMAKKGGIVSLKNCWQVSGHYQLLTDITSTSTCQTSLTSPHNTRGAGFSTYSQPGRGLRDSKLTLKAFKLSLWPIPN